MKALIFYILTLCVCFIPASGQQEPAVQDPLAEPVLDELAMLFSTENAFHVEFRYEVESTADNYNVEDYGSVIIKGNKYKLKTDEGEVIFNGTRMWTYNPVNEEVYVSTPDPENMDQLLVVPFTLLTKYKEYFKYKFKGENKSGSKIYYEIDLYPVNLECSYSILRIQTEKSSGRLHSFTLQQKNGIIFRVFLTEMIPNVKISPDTFEWKKELYPDVLIIEL